MIHGRQDLQLIEVWVQERFLALRQQTTLLAKLTKEGGSRMAFANKSHIAILVSRQNPDPFSVLFLTRSHEARHYAIANISFRDR